MSDEDFRIYETDKINWALLAANGYFSDHFTVQVGKDRVSLILGPQITVCWLRDSQKLKWSGKDCLRFIRGWLRRT